MFGLVLLWLLAFISMSIVATKQHSMPKLHLMLLACSVLIGFQTSIREHPRERYLCDIIRESHMRLFIIIIINYVLHSSIKNDE